MADEIFEVFGRISSLEPLMHVGYVNAPGIDLAKVYAHTVYNEENWIELCVVNRGDIIPVYKEDDNLNIKGN
ncbi:MAG: hypothetical protein IIB39_09910 [Candidatus Marinimicrobia bacterium]|nr:hypothetical protein [Candidatus Neomarinimicrobiota bacterium]